VKQKLSLEGIDKTYPENGIHACRQVSLTASAGETVAVIGENGSGKSTLMKILCGYLKPDSGTIRLEGEEHHFASPGEALEAGIGMVHQQVQLIPRFTAMENLILGNETVRFPGWIDRRSDAKKLRALADRYGISIDLSKRAASLNAIERQNLSILHLLSREVRTIILDEPTTIFDDSESEYLYRLMAGLKEEGRTVFLVTHKLREAIQVADRIIVLREGSTAASLLPEESDPDLLARLMIGSGKDPEKRPALAQVSGSAGRRKSRREGHPLLELDGISCSCAGFPVIRDLSLRLYPGEAVALLGMREAGLETVERLLAGIAPPAGGSFRLFNESYPRITSDLLRSKGVAYVPTDRMVRGASVSSTVAENLILLNYRHFHGFAKMKDEEIERFTASLFEEYEIRGEAGDRLDALSGGNIQKVIIGRELSRTPALIFFAEPSWGLDVASRQRVLAKIEVMKNKGSGILLLTSDIDEALAVADRIAVLHNGSIAAEMPVDEISRTAAGKLMLEGVVSEV
jgi:simple sugar transport system ATP-binding protein